MLMITNWKCSEGVDYYKNENEMPPLVKLPKCGSQKLLDERNRIIKVIEMLSCGSKCYTPNITETRYKIFTLILEMRFS